MGEILKKRLKMSKFESPIQEAILSVMVASSYLRSEVDKAGSPFGISGEQYNILRILKGVSPEGHACGEIGNRMLDRSPDITRRIDALEKLGLVERKRSEQDRRVVITKITEKGLTMLEQLTPGFQSYESKLQQKLTNEECGELARLCEKLFEADV